MADRSAIEWATATWNPTTGCDRISSGCDNCYALALARRWIGVSVESAERLYRVENLRAVPAAVRFLSCGPLLAPLGDLDLTGIGWVIAGGESGHDYRPIAAEWVRQLRDACQGQSVPFFFKLGTCWDRQRRHGGKGNDPAAWPADLRRREFPRAAASAR